MKKLTGHEIDTWQLSAHEVEVLTDAADQKDEDKNSLFLDFDESTILIENCDGEFFMCIFEQGKGIERVFSLLQDTGMYKVMCSVGTVAFEIGDDTIEAEFTGFVHETWGEAERELDEATHHPAVRCAWIEAI